MRKLAVPEDYRERMRQKVFEADTANLDRHPITIQVSRQQCADLIDAFNQLNQMNPWFRGVARRLRDLSIQMRDQLDASGVNDGEAKIVKEKD